MIHIESAQVVAALCTLVLSVVGFLIVRAVRSVDSSLTKLSVKVDGLAATDTNTLIQLADLRARVVAVEFLVGMKPGIPAESKP